MAMPTQTIRSQEGPQGKNGAEREDIIEKSIGEVSD